MQNKKKIFILIYAYVNEMKIKLKCINKNSITVCTVIKYIFAIFKKEWYIDLSGTNFFFK